MIPNRKAGGLTSDERATYQALRDRGYSHNAAYNDALDGVHVDDVREAAKHDPKED